MSDLATETQEMQPSEPDWRAVSEARQVLARAALVRVAMGPIIGAVVAANLISGAVGALVYYVVTH